MAMVKPPSDKSSWTTGSEISWLDSIGDAYEESKNKGMDVASRVILDRKELLRGYLEGAKRRSRWDKMDRIACIGHAKNLLTKLENTK